MPRNAHPCDSSKIQAHGRGGGGESYHLSLSSQHWDIKVLMLCPQAKLFTPTCVTSLRYKWVQNTLGGVENIKEQLPWQGGGWCSFTSKLDYVWIETPELAALYIMFAYNFMLNIPSFCACSILISLANSFNPFVCSPYEKWLWGNYRKRNTIENRDYLDNFDNI